MDIKVPFCILILKTANDIIEKRQKRYRRLLRRRLFFAHHSTQNQTHQRELLRGKIEENEKKSGGKDVKRKRRSVVFEWAISYLLVIGILLIAIFLNYTFNSRVVKKEIEYANQLIFDNLCIEIDSRIEKMTDIYNEIYMDVIFKSWVTHAEKDEQFYYDTCKLLEQVQEIMQFCPELSCTLYLKEEEYILTDNTANTDKMYYNSLRFLHRTDVGYEQWKELLNKEYSNELIFAENMHSKTGEKCLVYANTIQGRNVDTVSVFISIPLSELRNLMEGLESEAYFLLKNKDMLVDVSDIKEIPGDIITDMECESEGWCGTKQYMKIIKASIHKSLQYAMIVPTQGFWNEFLYIRNVSLAIIGTTCLIVVAMIILLLKNNYRPVSRLLQKVNGNRGVGNEFYQIELAYGRANYERLALQSNLKEQKGKILGSYMFLLMSGRITELSASETAFIELEKERDKNLFLMKVQVPKEQVNQYGIDEMLAFTIENVVTELMQGYKFCKMEEDNYLWYLFWIPSDYLERFKNKYEEMVSYLLRLFEEKWDVMLQVGCSDFLVEMDELPHAYRKMILGEGETQNTEEEKESIEIRGMVRGIKEYIEEHYADPNLNISSIAVKVNRNPKYISRIFKENVGESILDCLNSSRIARAKELIATRRYSLEEIGTMVGYSSYKTFRRAFEKQTGISPGIYMTDLVEIQAYEG